ncbi:EAL domain-containing protein [Gilvimarinus sp. SDUM040013]|uniref:cyclic-guanylate-specific phosphodiesterase n=1 Tax=Gilvimarinus gilvus TaxID=3058038 RepID=A0ABU4RZ56_9GAMM|nr:EAL domain-containing protein [Gilvimarinus sp. SDUM040013]MDO3384611.1 EAL domain-containing protein [Gilvimarinus sp. SDUM040013]MDX6850197.1 EAL domain-containing protein [Gilvimarinus sp. SDUM040013]
MSRIHVYSLVLSTALAIIIVIGLYAASTHLMRWDMTRQSQSIYKLMDHLNRDAQSSWQRLENSYSVPCSAKQLQEMRSELFLTWHIRDIAFTDGSNILCTATAGVLSVPKALPEITYVAIRGAQISINQDWPVLGNMHDVAMARRGHFVLVVDPRSLENFVELPYPWELVHFLGGVRHHAAGLILNSEATVNHKYFGQFRVEQCNNFGYCVNVLSDIHTYLARNLPTTGLIVLLAYLFGWFSYVRIRRYLNHRQSIEYRVRRGVAADAFYPLVQPVVELESQRVIGCEVLARFRDARGDLYPDQFIPVVASQGLSWPFTINMIEKALHEIRENDLEDKISVAFNFMPRDITNGKILDLLQNPLVVGWKGQLTIELTESEEFEGSEAHQVLYKLSQAGFDIAIDDFGTGYSNLKYIDQLHCSYLKIDRTFVMDVEEGAIRSSIIPNIVSIANKAGLRVIAEGVENLAQATQLHNMGVKYVQGYFYGRPMSAAKLQEKIDE